MTRLSLALFALIAFLTVFVAPSPIRAQVDFNAPMVALDHQTSAVTLTASASPSSRPKIEAQPSALELSYQERVIDTVAQFGYDVFSVSRRKTLEDYADHTLPRGAMRDDYILGQGDVLTLTLSGAQFYQNTLELDSQGYITAKGLQPLLAQGRTLDAVRADIQRLAQNQLGASAHLNVSQIRQISVLIAGHVSAPGLKRLHALSSVMDALHMAGGVSKAGSLRQIKLIRGGERFDIDLYGLFMQAETASAADMRLRDGDRLIAPALGPTFSVTGSVKRPAIYELLPALRGMHYRPDDKAQRLSLNDALGYAGGALSGGAMRYLNLAYDRQGQETVEAISLDQAHAPLLGNGSILQVNAAQSKRAGQIELLGETRMGGLHALSLYKTLGALLSDKRALGEDIYPLIGILQRWSDETLSMSTTSFPLRLVLNGAYDQLLSDGDRIMLLSHNDIKSLRAQPMEHLEIKSDSNRSDIQGGDSHSESKNTLPSHESSSLLIDDALQAFWLERALFVRGAVRRSGIYPVSETETLDAVLAAAGGMSLEASQRAVELIRAHGSSAGTQREIIDLTRESAANISVQAGDSVRVNQRFHKIADESVLLLGEVVYPGRYDLMAGEKLSDLFERAGGLQPEAYPKGAVFSRESERRAEEKRFQSQARMIRQAIATSMHDTSEAKSPSLNSAQIAEARALAAELEAAKGIGRITVEADPAILASDPAVDILLEAGDRIFIPRRNLSVRVSGEVLAPAALQFKDGKDPLDYIHEAGGFTYHADQDRSFVVYPNGAAQPLQVSSWNHKPTFIPPGSTIIVPRDPKPFDFISRFKDVTQILSNLAVTAIFVDDLRDD